VTPPPAAANEVPAPPGGWDALKSSGQLVPSNTPAPTRPLANGGAPAGKNATAL